MIRIEQGKPYLFPRDTPLSIVESELTSWSWAFPTAWDKWVSSLGSRRPVTNVIEGLAHLKSKETARDHILEGGQFSLGLDLEHKRANGLRAALITHNNDPEQLSVFGLDTTYAMNHADFTDHGIPHVRRIHRVMDQVILRVPELRHSASIQKWLPALELFPHNHDLDQVLTLFRNKILRQQLIADQKEDNYEQLKLPSKTAHGLAAAVMTMALYKRYNAESGMTLLDLERAKQTCFAAALMMIKHEEPDQIDAAFSPINSNGTMKRKGSDKRYSQQRGLRNLMNDFNKNLIDLFSLSPSQIMQILTEKKRQGGFVKDGSKYGLHPHFEKEYKKELTELYSNKKPMFAELTNEERRSFTLATKVAVFADEVEMVYPPYPSLIRSLKTDVSRTRAWWSKNASIEEMYKTFAEKGGNLKNDDSQSSDSYRLLWEVWNLMEKTRKARERQANHTHQYVFDVETAPYVNQIAREHVLMRLFAIRDFGESLMRAQNAYDITRTLHQIYTKRKDALTRKALSRAPRITRLEKIMHKHIHEDDLLRMLNQHREEYLYDQYGFRIRLLNNEQKIIQRIIEGKPNHGVYTDTEINTFLELCDRLIGDACNIYEISEKEARSIHKRMLFEQDFYKTYDPLGGLPDTVREPAHFQQWQQILNGSIRGEQFWNLREDTMAKENVLNTD